MKTYLIKQVKASIALVAGLEKITFQDTHWQFEFEVLIGV